MTVLWAASLLFLVLARDAEPPAEPLTNEAVVRMLVAGVSEAEVLEAIRTRPVRFDLSPEMIEELRRAGVPETIIAAMRSRQRAEGPREPPRPKPPPEPVGSLRLEVHLDAGPVRLPPQLPPEAAQRLQLEGDTAIEDAALFVACLTPEHVPDYWRNASPLGRDFVSMPRHRILAFFAGAKAGRKGRLELQPPEETKLGCPHEGPHELVVGIAARVGGRFLALAIERAGRAPGEGETLRLNVRPRRAFPYAELSASLALLVHEEP